MREKPKTFVQINLSVIRASSGGETYDLTQTAAQKMTPKSHLLLPLWARQLLRWTLLGPLIGTVFDVAADLAHGFAF